MRTVRHDQREKGPKGRTYEPAKGCICQSPATRTRARGPHGRTGLADSVLLFFLGPHCLSGSTSTKQCRRHCEASIRIIGLQQIHSIRKSDYEDGFDDLGGNSRASTIQKLCNNFGLYLQRFGDWRIEFISGPEHQ